MFQKKERISELNIAIIKTNTQLIQRIVLILLQQNDLIFEYLNCKL